MPKEQINYSPSAVAGSIEKYATATGDGTVVHVGWNKDGEWVQVGLEVEADYAIFAAANPNGATLTRTLMWTPVLSPSEIDKLISVLRKAKRKAYSHA